MDSPETLPAQLYLLAYDSAKRRLVGRGRLATLLRAAALAELALRGHLYDADGTPRANARVPLPTDPVLAGVLDDVASSRPRPWRYWIYRHRDLTKAAVQAQLVDGGWIEVGERRALGLLPVTEVRLRQPQAATRVADRVRAALRDTTPVSAVEPHDAALVAIAAAAELPTVFARGRLAEYQARIAALTEHAGPAATAVCDALASGDFATDSEGT